MNDNNLRTNLYGSKHGLSFVIKINRSKNEENLIDLPRVIVHSRTSYPSIQFSSSAILTKGRETFVAVTEVYHTIDRIISAFDSEKRKCLFKNEEKLMLFPKYTYAIIKCVFIAMYALLNELNLNASLLSFFNYLDTPIASWNVVSNEH